MTRVAGRGAVWRGAGRGAVRPGAMRRAAAGAAGSGGARAGAPPGNALGPDPAAYRRGGRGAGLAGLWPLPAQPPGHAPGASSVGAQEAGSLVLDLTPDASPETFVMRVLLEETREMFQVTKCRSDMTVRELKEELDLTVGIPLDLQRLQYLDQGDPCPPLPSPRVPPPPGRPVPSEPAVPEGMPAHVSPPPAQVSEQTPPQPLESPDGKASPGHARTSQCRQTGFTLDLKSQGRPCPQQDPNPQTNTSCDRTLVPKQAAYSDLPTPSRSCPYPHDPRSQQRYCSLSKTSQTLRPPMSLSGTQISEPRQEA